MAKTYDLISSTTLGSNSATVTFSSIAASWTDLKLVAFINGSNGYLNATFNSDSGSNYTYLELVGAGSSVLTNNSSAASSFVMNAVSSTTIPTFSTIDVFSYAGPNYKTVLALDSLDKNGSGQVRQKVCVWLSTSAITRLDLTCVSGNIYAGSVFSLYGIKAA
jgi:hypothetical protein